jgi:hypothetical protein
MAKAVLINTRDSTGNISSFNISMIQHRKYEKADKTSTGCLEKKPNFLNDPKDMSDLFDILEDTRDNS